MDIFKHVPLFIAGWPGEHLVIIKTPRPALIRQHISNTILQLQYKAKSISSYDVEIFERGGVLSCKGITLMFLPAKEYAMCSMIWNARRGLMKERNDVHSGEGLWLLFSGDPDYGIRRLAGIQRQDLDIGKLLDVYKLVKGPFGLSIL